ncbi:MAG: CHAT domain-containing protein [Saprospiraceae bacterium]|nr:CHAT domain-containing protein [Saprospiraceae bacterium]
MSRKIATIMLTGISLAFGATAQTNCYALLLKSDTLVNTFKWNEAALILEKAYQVCIEEHGYESDESAWVHHNLANYHYSKLNTSLSDSLWNISEELYGRHCGTNSVEYGLVLLAKAERLQAIGRYMDAFNWLKRAEAIFREQLGTTHTTYGSACNALGSVYGFFGFYEKAAEYLSYSVQLEASLNGKQTPRYASRVNNLALISLQKGDYELTSELIGQSLQLIDQTKDSLSREFLVINFNKGVLLVNTGQYEAVIKHCDYYLSLFDRNGLRKHPLYYYFLNTKLTAWVQTGQFDQVEKYAKIILEELESQPELAGILGVLIREKLINSYLLTNQFEKGIPIAYEALSILETTAGKNSFNYFIITSTLSHLLYYANRNEEAIAAGLTNMQNIKGVLGENTLPMLLQETVLAKAYARAGQFDEAVKFSQSSVDHGIRVYGQNHSQYISLLGSLVRMLDLSGNTAAADAHFAKLTELVQSNMTRLYGFFSEKEQLNYLAYSQANLEFMENYAARNVNRNPELAALLFNNNAVLKGAQLDDSKNRRAWLLQNADSSSAVLQKEWTNIGQALAKQYSQVVEKRTIQDVHVLDSLETAFQQIQQRLSDGSADFRRAFANKKTGWSEVRNRLGKNEALVDFIKFNTYHSDTDIWSDSIMYAALIARRDWETPKLVMLFEEKELERRLALANEPLGSAEDVISGIYSPQLYRLIWQPLEKYFKGAKTVWLCPEGLLHKVAFHSTPLPGGDYAGFRYDLRNIGSPRDLLQDSPLYASELKDALVYGGIQYDIDDKQLSCLSEQTASQNSSGIAQARRSGACNEKLSFLAKTRQESDHVATILHTNRIPVVAKQGCEASEDHFKAACNKLQSLSLIHLPTHGKFCRPPISNDGVTKGSDIVANPLMYSSLALAGYNRKVAGLPMPQHLEDGELTAYEVSHFLLLETKLVVLSACVSGLGETQSTEGVFGLQRAFRLAGARHVLVSLWQVDDAATTLLMQYFYHNWLNKKMDARQALRAAQQKMQQSKEYDHPYYWAGFVFI